MMKKKWELRFFGAGLTGNSIQALNNLKEIYEENLKGEYSVEIIDLPEKPELAAGKHITALPKLVRKLPEPIVKIIGNLSGKEKVLVGLDLIPHT